MKNTNLELILHFVQLFEKIAVVNCTPISQFLIENKCAPAILGLGEGLEHLKGFRTWSLKNPTYIEESFEMIFAEIDPSLCPIKQCEALQILAKFDNEKPLMLLVPDTHKLSVKKAFSAFALEPRTHALIIDEIPFVLLSNWEVSL